jgi:glycosyltransferase involved in cell wall biosynthesis
LIPIVGLLGLVRPKRIALFPAGGLLADELKLLPGIAQWIYIKFLKAFDLIIVQAERMAVQLNKLGLENVLHYPNFKPRPDLALIKRINNTPEKNGRLKIVFLSRIKPEKGIETLLTAMQLLSWEKFQFELHIFGILTNDYRKRFFKLIEQSPWAVYHGQLDMQEVIPTIALYDLMVFPTQWHNEGFPGVLVDAAMAGVPVVATRLAYNEEIVKDEINGLISKVNDPAALAEKIRLILENPNLLRRFAENNMKLASKYDAKHVLNELTHHLKQLKWCVDHKENNIHEKRYPW